MNNDLIHYFSPHSDATSPSGTRAGVIWLIGSKGVQERIKASDSPIKFLEFAQSSNKLICLGTPSDDTIELMRRSTSRFQIPQTGCTYGISLSHGSSGLQRTDFLRRSRRLPRAFEV